MLRITRLLLPLAAVLALLPATGAQAAKATFSAVFEAHRSVKWDQPRGVSQITCRGENYYLANGGEEAGMKTKPFKVTIQTYGPKTAFWKFGETPNPTDPRSHGIEAKGPHKRWFDDTAGSTGGWCGGGSEDPGPERDCGTKLPTYLVNLSALGGKMTWTAGTVPWMANEKLDFSTCTLVPPTGMHSSSFPSLEAKYKQADLFNRRKKSVTIGASRKYGPDVTPIANLGVNRTMSGSSSWKLTLTRAK
jgi:hypothetical protein